MLSLLREMLNIKEIPFNALSWKGLDNADHSSCPQAIFHRHNLVHNLQVPLHLLPWPSLVGMSEIPKQTRKLNIMPLRGGQLIQGQCIAFGKDMLIGVAAFAPFQKVRPVGQTVELHTSRPKRQVRESETRKPGGELL